MNPVYKQAGEFLEHRKIAVVGVSTNRETTANFIYRKLRDAGYTVFALSKSGGSIDGAPSYPDLRSLPEKVDGVVIVTRPSVTEEIVRQCSELGIPRVWMHCSLGTRPAFKHTAASITSVSEAAVQWCRDHGIEVIPGGCPMMFIESADPGHRFIRGMVRWSGGFRT